MSFEQLRHQIAVRLDLGHDLATVDRESIKPARWLNDDQRAALWLFAWSYRERSNKGLSHFSGGIAS